MPGVGALIALLGLGTVAFIVVKPRVEIGPMVIWLKSLLRPQKRG
jgi:hypothetical protein